MSSNNGKQQVVPVKEGSFIGVEEAILTATMSENIVIFEAEEFLGIPRDVNLRARGGETP
jgi:hypothetical protein